jgi:hypothetical protein
MQIKVYIIMCILIQSRCVLNFILPAYRPDFVEVACTTKRLGRPDLENSCSLLRMLLYIAAPELMYFLCTVEKYVNLFSLTCFENKQLCFGSLYHCI